MITGVGELRCKSEINLVVGERFGVGFGTLGRTGFGNVQYYQGEKSDILFRVEIFYHSCKLFPFSESSQ